MNKNQKRVKKEQRKQNKQAGFTKPVFKKKKKDFPNPNGSLSLIDQIKIFYGPWHKINQ